ncbi:UNVERIFIED_CONTAM: hypothetical protein K2H54_049900 [Gekko kuhli]
MNAIAAPEAAVVLQPIRSVKMLTMGEQKKIIPMPKDPTHAADGRGEEGEEKFSLGGGGGQLSNQRDNAQVLKKKKRERKGKGGNSLPQLMMKDEVLPPTENKTRMANP